MNKSLDKIYESLVVAAPVEGEARLVITKDHSIKDMFGEIKKYIASKYGDEVLDMLEKNVNFDGFKERLLNMLYNCDVSDDTKLHLAKKINRATNICSLYSIINTNHILG